MRLYTYVIAVDAGAAPNIEPPLTTLAICKPRIRLGAEVGDMVLAFNGQRIGSDPHAVCWAGVVCEKLEFHEYWLDPRFRKKRPGGSKTPDNIYKPQGADLVQVPNESHKPWDIQRDVSGRFVLAFRPMWYFGSRAPSLPAALGLRMVGGRRGHRVHDLSAGRYETLKGWLDEQGSGVRPHNPRSADFCSALPAKRPRRLAARKCS